MTSGTAARREHERRAALAATQKDHPDARRFARARVGAGVVGTVVVVALVAFGLLSARPKVSDESREAPGFSLETSTGGQVSLADHRGQPVVLYFSEGAGCDSCLLQMAEIEKDPAFAEAGITVLPIVMSSAEDINADRERLGVRTPFLLDDGTVSDAYGTIGTGMHEGLPGHGFVLVDADGVQRWYGSYPSMWLDPTELLRIVQDEL